MMVTSLVLYQRQQNIEVPLGGMTVSRRAPLYAVRCGCILSPHVCLSTSYYSTIFEILYASIVGVCDIRLTLNFLTSAGLRLRLHRWAQALPNRPISRCIYLTAPTSFAPRDLRQDLIPHTAARSPVRPKSPLQEGIAQTTASACIVLAF
jgi:hypothetical protein